MNLMAALQRHRIPEASTSVRRYQSEVLRPAEAFTVEKMKMKMKGKTPAAGTNKEASRFSSK